MNHAADGRQIHLPQAALTGVALLSLVVQLTACTSSPRTQTPHDELTEPAPGADIVPGERPSEAGFFSLVERYCGALAVGDEAISARLRGDPVFRQLTSDLFHGDLTNDQYIRRLMTRYPAADANVDAAGCVVNQMQKCYTERCSVPVTERPLPERSPPDALEVYDSGRG